jgi:hypothetical protein
MAAYSATTIKELHAASTDKDRSAQERGKAFEDLFCYVLNEVPGLKARRNILNFSRSEEVDVAVANTRTNNGLACFPHLFLVECKNWSAPVDSATIGSFVDKLTNRCIELGVLVVANGVTGDPEEMSSAYDKAKMALQRGHRLLLISLDDITSLNTPIEFTDLLVDRLLGLIAAGTFQLPANC